jgi:MFS family permease
MLSAMTRRLTFARALRARRFALLWSGQTISSLGDGAFFTALAWQVLTLTGSGSAMGMALVAETVPIVLFMLIGGVVADRLPRRLMLLWSDGGRAAVTLVVAGLGIARLLQFWHLLALAFLFGLAEAFFRPAYQSIPPELVSPDDLPSANALTSLSRNVSMLIGPAIGAALVGLSSPSLAFAFDGLTFIASAVCLVMMGRVDSRSEAEPIMRAGIEGHDDVESVWAVRAMVDAPVAGVAAAEIEAPTPARAAQGLRGMLADIREGMGYITGSTWLWLTIALASLGNVGMAPLQVALPKLIHDTYHQGVWLLGATLSATAVGSMAAALVMGQIGRVRHRGVLAYLGLLLTNIAEISFGLPIARQLAPGLPLAAGVGIGVGVGFFEIVWITTLQELVPADKLGRVSSVDWMGSLLLQPIGLAVVGSLTDAMGPSWVFIAGGALNLALTLIGLASRDIRHLD